MSVFFSNDTNLTKIEKTSKLDKFKCTNYYRVYGLAQKDNPPVLISYQTLPNGKTEGELKRLLKKQGIPVEFEKLKYDNLTIGLRLDLRWNFGIAAAVANTIVGFLENKLKINDDFAYIGLKRISSDLLEKKVDFTHLLH